MGKFENEIVMEDSESSQSIISELKTRKKKNTKDKERIEIPISISPQT